MVRGWGDSSDEEDDKEEEEIPKEPTDPPKKEIPKEATDPPKEEPHDEGVGTTEEAVQRSEEAPREPPKPKVFEFPSEPPYTAYVGNLPYSIADAEQFATAVLDNVQQHLQIDTIVVKEAKLIMDHQSGRPKGFGYLEVETVDQLKDLMKLAGRAQIDGRRINFDVSMRKQSRGSFRRSFRQEEGRGQVDGNSFRGGKFAKEETNEDPRQRPSLKLKPRSKPVDGDSNNTSTSSIFGGGKARDEGSWRERRDSERDLDKGRGGGREGRGGGRDGGRGGGREGGRSGGRDGGRDGGGRGRGRNSARGREGGRGRDGGRSREGGRSFRDGKSPKPKAKEAATKSPVAKALAPPPKEEAPKKETKLNNKFDVLMMDDSDSD